MTVDEGHAAVDLLALDGALTALAIGYEQPARIVMLRFFTGLTIEKIGELLDVTSRTVEGDFLFARTWLRRHIGTG